MLTSSHPTNSDRVKPLPSSAQPWNIGRHFTFVFCELFAELRCKQGIFDADTDFSSNKKDGESGYEEHQRREDQPGADQQAQHRCIDGMPHKRIRTGTNELVVRIQASVDTPLATDCSNTSPGQ